MKSNIKRGNVSKVYCEKCDTVFDTKEKFQKHFDAHNTDGSSESCPLDTITQKLMKLFKRDK